MSESEVQHRVQRPAAVWEGNSLTWNPEQTDPYVSGIVEGRTYLVAALLDVDQ